MKLLELSKELLVQLGHGVTVAGVAKEHAAAEGTVLPMMALVALEEGAQAVEGRQWSITEPSEDVVDLELGGEEIVPELVEAAASTTELAHRRLGGDGPPELVVDRLELCVHGRPFRHGVTESP